MLSKDSRERLGRHAVEMAAVAVIGVGLAMAGVFPDDLPVWVFPCVFVVGALLIVIAYTKWDRDADAAGVRSRISLQCGALMAITYTTGWGFALPLVHLFAVADNVKYAGSRSVRPTIIAAAAWTTVGQALLTAGLLPSVHEETGDTWAIAGFMVLAVTQVAGRIRQMTEAREEAQDDLIASERRFRSLVEDSSDVVLVIREGVITYQSPSAEVVLGLDASTADGTPYLDHVHPEDRDRVVSQVLELLDQPGVSKVIDCRVRHAEGHYVQVETRTRNLNSNVLVGGFVVNLRDVTERRELEAQLEHRAFHDPLTALPNRALFRDRVGRAVARADRHQTEVAVLYVDLDGFKGVNDALGHGAGDAVLVEVASRVTTCIRDSDSAARLGGDEFAILLEDFGGPDGPGRVAARLLEAMQLPVTIEGSEVPIGASVGIAVFRTGWTAEELTRNADLAMYMAKSGGKGRYEIFEPEMHLAVVERLAMERDLSMGLARDEFVLHYQPIVALDHDAIVGVEALVRWQHPERGTVSPGTFIPIAEETGLIVPLGHWVLREALRQVVEWQALHPMREPLGVSVNVSMRQLAHPDFLGHVRGALEDTGIEPATVTLELTESALVHDTERTVDVLRQLKGLGVRLAIDDFGTGYSSLAYLQRFPLDVLKIDRSFVEGMVNGTQSPALVRAIIEMSRSLDLQTVAEGIEREEELTRVRALQCTLGQGYLFARPATSAQLGEILRTSRLGVEAFSGVTVRQSSAD